MFRLNKNGELFYYTVDSFSKSGLVKHCFTTRKGGVSKNEYESLNLRFNTEDERENVVENFRIICDEIGIDHTKLVFSKQVHEDKIITVTKENCGEGIIKPIIFESADGLITNEKNVPLVIFSADCVPIAFLDVKQGVIALSHSGWKGTVKNIAGKTVRKMAGEFGSDPKNIICAIGASIGECHFEVGDDVAEFFKRLDGGEVKKYNDKYHVDLQTTVTNQLLKEGIPNENITNAKLCTYCNEELFYSHRRMGNKRGNLAAIMELK